MHRYGIPLLICCLLAPILASCGSDTKEIIENGDLVFTYDKQRHNFDLFGFGSRVRIQKAHVRFTTPEGAFDQGDSDFQHVYDQGRFDSDQGAGEYFSMSFTDPWKRHDGGTTYRLYDEGRRFSIESRLTNTSKENLTILLFQPLAAYPDLGGGVTVGAEASTVTALAQDPGKDAGGRYPFSEMVNRQGVSSWQSVVLVQPDRKYSILMHQTGHTGLMYHLKLNQPADKKIGPPLSLLVSAVFQDPAGSYDPRAEAQYGPAIVEPGATLTSGELMIQYQDRAVDDLHTAVGELNK